MTQGDFPAPEERRAHKLSPEDRRRRALRDKGGPVRQRIGPGSRLWEIVQRVVTGTYSDGLIHAGNLAYMTVLAMFPFFIVGAAIFSAIGETGERAAMVDAVLMALPPMVADVIGPVAHSVIEARTGPLLWIGGLVGLWTVGSLIETIRDILRRAYGTEPMLAFWKYRLFSTGIIVLSVVVLMLSLLLQVLIGAAHEVIAAFVPWLDEILSDLSLSRIIPALGLFGSLYFLFYALTPKAYRSRRYPKWPGALLTTAWWLAVSIALPPVLRSFFTYSLTYGALSGMMISLFFFWLVGLGLVIGAELNAALAVTPEEEMNRSGSRSASAGEDEMQQLEDGNP